MELSATTAEVDPISSVSSIVHCVESSLVDCVCQATVSQPQRLAMTVVTLQNVLKSVAGTQTAWPSGQDESHRPLHSSPQKTNANSLKSLQGAVFDLVTCFEGVVSPFFAGQFERLRTYSNRASDMASRLRTHRKALMSSCRVANSRHHLLKHMAPVAVPATVPQRLSSYSSVLEILLASTVGGPWRDIERRSAGMAIPRPTAERMSRMVGIVHSHEELLTEFASAVDRYYRCELRRRAEAILSLREGLQEVAELRTFA